MDKFLSSIVWALTIGTAQAAVVYDESVSGDLVNGQTVVPWNSPGFDLGALAVGGSSVLGSFGRPAGGSTDTDVLTWTIAPGTKLDAIRIDYTILEGDNGNGSYLAIAAGPTVGTGMATATSNLSDVLVPASSELLTAWAAGPYQFGTGLSRPLRPARIPCGPARSAPRWVTRWLSKSARFLNRASTPCCWWVWV